MAILFNDAQNEYLQCNAPITAPPFSMSCWFRTDDVAVNQALMCFADKDTPDDLYYMQIVGTEAGPPADPIRAFSYGPEGNASAWSTTGVTVNTWHHALAVFADYDDRRIYLDGGSKDTDGTTITPASMDSFAIGRACDSSPGAYMSGRIADAAAWTVALTDADAALLAAGYAAGFVQPQELRHWYPLWNVDDLIPWGYGPPATPLTAYNTPASADGPPIIYPSPPYLHYPPAVVAWLETGRLFLYTAANWGCPRTWYFEATMYAPVGTAHAKLYDLTAAADVASSEITTASATKTRVRSAAVTLVDGHVYEARLGALPSATCAASGACLVGVPS